MQDSPIKSLIKIEIIQRSLKRIRKDQKAIKLVENIPNKTFKQKSFYVKISKMY